MLPVLVLTAGLGTRLDPLTRLVAKPAVPLGDRTLIEHVLAWLRRSGVTDAVLNLHHRPATITRVVGDGAHLGLRVRYSWEQPVLGSAGGPRRALALVAESRFAIVNGDTLCSVDLGALVAAHAQSGAAVTLAVVPNPAPLHYNGLVAGADGRVTGFVPRGPDARGSWHFVGIQIAEAEVFAGLADGVPAETVSGIYRALVAARPGALHAVPVSEPFTDVGTPADYLRAAAVYGGAPRGTVVWPGAVVEPGASLDACVVAGAVRVPPGFSISRWVLVPADLWREGDAASVQDGIAVFPIRDT